MPKEKTDVVNSESYKIAVDKIQELEAQVEKLREQLWKCASPHTMACSIHETDPKLICCDCGFDELLKGE